MQQKLATVQICTHSVDVNTLLTSTWRQQGVDAQSETAVVADYPDFSVEWVVITEQRNHAVKHHIGIDKTNTSTSITGTVKRRQPNAAQFPISTGVIFN